MFTKKIAKTASQLLLSFILVFSLVLPQGTYAEVKTVYLDQDNPTTTINADCGGSNLKITVFGGSEQTSQITFDIRRKNLFDKDNIKDQRSYQADYKVNATGITVTNKSAGTSYTADELQLKPNTVYNVKAKSTLVGVRGGGIRIYDDSITTLIGGSNSIQNPDFSFTTPDNGGIAILFYSGVELGDVATFTEVQIEEGNTASKFEEFGGTVLYTGETLMNKDKLILNIDGIVEVKRYTLADQDDYEKYLGTFSLQKGINHITVLHEGDFTASIEYDDSVEGIIEQLANQVNTQTAMMKELLNLLNESRGYKNISFQYDENGNIVTITE
ncbi:hypothetical protein [Fusibacter sp. JL216-2]|uniref:hypothetical protein n=1 Tax=Fusibacter sp. JL216-2 TaxID=3071453 RepID=UPI003D34197C